MRRLTIISLAFVVACGGDDTNHHAGPDAPLDAPPFTGETFPLTTVMGGIIYMVSTQIGTQNFAMIADTGSTTMAVASIACGSCGVSPEYTAGASGMDQMSVSQATYGDGTSWHAENFSDTVELVGERSSVNMRFGSIQTQQGFFRGIDNQGIIGFAGDIIALPGTDAFVTKRIAAGDVGEFAFQLCPTSGTMWWGGYDGQFTASPAQFSPMKATNASQPFYEVTIAKTTIGTTSVSLTGPAVVDTGTSVIIVPPAVHNSMLTQITTSAGYKSIFGSQTLTDNTCVDPGTKTFAEIDAALPPFAITLPGVGGADITLSLPATQSYLLNQDGMMCFGVAGASGVPIILGDTFLRGFVTIFDITNKQMGFAAQKGCTLPAIAPHFGPKSLTPPHYYMPRVATNRSDVP